MMIMITYNNDINIKNYNNNDNNNNRGRCLLLATTTGCMHICLLNQLGLFRLTHLRSGVCYK